MLITRLLTATDFINKISKSRPFSDLAGFRKEFKEAKKIVVLTGAGVSAESGIPTFREEHSGQYRDTIFYASAQTFKSHPSLMWQFYHQRRELAFSKFPNDAHKAIAECQARLAKEGRDLTVITQNIDGLHQRAGTEGVIELHGSLFKTLCFKCGDVVVNLDSPICPALARSPEQNDELADIPEEDLPRCKKNGCGGLLRPYVVWFGENLDPVILELSEHVLSNCDLCLVVGTSSVVYPAAAFAPQVASRGVPVAEFNIEFGHNIQLFQYYFEGPCTKTIPPALAP